MVWDRPPPPRGPCCITGTQPTLEQARTESLDVTETAEKGSTPSCLAHRMPHYGSTLSNAGGWHPGVPTHLELAVERVQPAQVSHADQGSYGRIVLQDDLAVALGGERHKAAGIAVQFGSRHKMVFVEVHDSTVVDDVQCNDE